MRRQKGTSVRGPLVIVGAALLLVLGVAWLALGSGDNVGPTPDGTERVSAASGRHLLKLDVERAVAREAVEGADYIVAPKVTPWYANELCFSVVNKDGDSIFGCGHASEMLENGSLFVEHGPSGTRVWAFTPSETERVTAGGRTLATPNGRFFSAIVPEGTESLTITGPAGSRAMRVPSRPTAH